MATQLKVVDRCVPMAHPSRARRASGYASIEIVPRQPLAEDQTSNANDDPEPTHESTTAIRGRQSQGRSQRRGGVLRILARDATRPNIFYTRVATCWHPRVKGLTIVRNGVFNAGASKTYGWIGASSRDGFGQDRSAETAMTPWRRKLPFDLPWANGSLLDIRA